VSFNATVRQMPERDKNSSNVSNAQSGAHSVRSVCVSAHRHHRGRHSSSCSAKPILLWKILKLANVRKHILNA